MTRRTRDRRSASAEGRLAWRGEVSGAPSERTLILLRHAKSDWSGDEADVARPLAKRGRRQATDAGRWLAANIVSIDLTMCHPPVARST